MNVQMRVHILRTLIAYPLIHMHQKKKIALEIAAKIVSVNRSYGKNGKQNINAIAIESVQLNGL
jgi:hypothetical protein